MPKRSVKQLWGQGNQDLGELAGAFDVSTIAMKRRLDHLGLTQRTGRHPKRQPAGHGRDDPLVFFRTQSPLMKEAA